MKIKDVAGFLCECNGVQDDKIHQGFLDILLPFRSRMREISVRETMQHRFVCARALTKKFGGRGDQRAL